MNSEKIAAAVGGGAYPMQEQMEAFGSFMSWNIWWLLIVIAVIALRRDIVNLLRTLISSLGKQIESLTRGVQEKVSEVGQPSPQQVAAYVTRAVKMAGGSSTYKDVITWLREGLTPEQIQLKSAEKRNSELEKMLAEWKAKQAELPASPAAPVEPEIPAQESNA